MVSFIKQEFSVDPAFVGQITSSMKEFRWLNEFINIENDGTITLFDISHGDTSSAIQQVIDCLDTEARNSVKMEIIVSDKDEVIRFTFDTKEHTIHTQYATDFVWD